MVAPRVNVERLPLRLTPDPRRVITRFFAASEERTRTRLSRVLSLSQSEADRVLSDLLDQFGRTQADITDTWSDHFSRVAAFLPSEVGTPERAHRLLIGAYFTMHYALEAAALFNPSIVPRIHQTGAAPGATLFTLSLRAVGEGHLSSIVFRTGAIAADNSITLDESIPEYRVLNAEPEAKFNTAELRHMLVDLGAYGPLADQLLARQGDTFSVAELLTALERLPAAGLLRRGSRQRSAPLHRGLQLPDPSSGRYQPARGRALPGLGQRDPRH